MTAREAMTQFLELMVQGDVARWLSLWSDDAVFEYPFAPPGYPPEVRGIEAITKHFQSFPEFVRFFEFVDVQMHAQPDPEMLITEFACRGEMVADGRPYNQRYIGVLHMTGGKISHYRDYWNPLVVLDAFPAPEAA